MKHLLDANYRRRPGLPGLIKEASPTYRMSSNSVESVEGSRPKGTAVFRGKDGGRVISDCRSLEMKGHKGGFE